MLSFLKRQAFRRGVLGTSRSWLAVWASVSALGLVRRVLSRKEETVFRGELQPGEVLVITHERDVIDVEERGRRR